MRHFLLCVGLSFTVLAALASPAVAQNWSGDARRIAMGGAGSGQNLASTMIEEEGGYRVIVIPLGLFQVTKNLDIFDPGSDEFDLVRSIEYASSPLHYTIDRDGTGSGAQFVNDLRNGTLSRDLNAYRGFVPVSQPVAYGLANPAFGGTIPVYRSDRSKQGVFVGAGPYFPFRGAMTIDQQLVNILSSDTDVYVANAQLPIAGDVRGELALAIIGGYRGRFALPGGTISDDSREGIYFAFNYNYLRGFRYEDALIAVRFDTDAQGLVTVNPSLPIPVSLARRSSESGRGFALDFGTAVLVRQWELGFGVNGAGNRIKWKEVEGTTYVLDTLFTGGDFIESPAVGLPDVTIEQPVEYTGNVGYHADYWTAVGQVSKRTSSFAPDEGRFDGTSARAGFEYRFGLLEPRVGTFYSRERWQPSAGIGLNLGKIGIDGAIYTTDANIQRKRRTTVALSLRIGNRPR